MTRRLSRRALLRGAGAAVALPWLEAMAPSVAWAQDSGAPPKRFLAWFAPNGIYMPQWTPEAEGHFAPKRILEPLGALLDQVLVVSGVHNRPGIPDGSGNHAAGTASFLTATHVKKTEGASLRNAKSVDQLIADHIGEGARFPSLQLGVQGGKTAGACDEGYSCAYNRNVSWSSPTTPLHKEINPKALYDRLFGGVDPAATREQIERRRRAQLSILDFVRADIGRLTQRLGATDTRKLDEYLTGVRAFERRLEGFQDPLACDAGGRPPDPNDLQHRIRLMSDLTVLAFRCDLTRVVSFMLGNGGGNQSYPWLGFADGHHLVSHHMGEADKQDKYTQICAWEMQEFAYLLEQLSAIEEGDGFVLDHTLCYFSSDVEDGDTHSHLSLPILLAGGGGWATSPGRHVAYSDGPPLANLLLSVLRAFGVSVEAVGDDSTGPLEGL